MINLKRNALEDIRRQMFLVYLSYFLPEIAPFFLNIQYFTSQW